MGSCPSRRCRPPRGNRLRPTPGAPRAHRAGDLFLVVAAGCDDDDTGTIDCGREVGRHAVDRGEPVLRARAFDLDAAARADIRKPRVVDVVQPQFMTGNPQRGSEVDAADPGADDGDRHATSPATRERSARCVG
jgi:hypothetical protein